VRQVTPRLHHTKSFPKNGHSKETTDGCSRGRSSNSSTFLIAVGSNSWEPIGRVFEDAAFIENSSWCRNSLIRLTYCSSAEQLSAAGADALGEVYLIRSGWHRELVVCLMAALLTSCGSSSKGGTNAPGLSGNWQIALQNGTLTRTQSGFVLQAGKALAGQFLLSGTCAGLGSAQGTVNGSDVSLTVSQSAQTVGLTGSATGDGSSITGSYSILGSGCGSSETGTWTGTRVKTLTGSFNGMFTSGVAGVQPFSFSGNVTQGSNAGTSNATLSGSMTSTNAACFSSASITGLISGTAVVFNLATSEGISLGQFRGTASADATTVTGSYDFQNARQAVLNCPGGDFGTGVLSVQPQ
jgi:hypothetical protein